MKFDLDSKDDKENAGMNTLQGKADGNTNITWNNMASLSSGQKTVVAISLIFALQRCDPVSVVK